jgi:hypothetical protein
VGGRVHSGWQCVGALRVADGRVHSGWEGVGALRVHACIVKRR